VQLVVLLVAQVASLVALLVVSLVELLVVSPVLAERTGQALRKSTSCYHFSHGNALFSCAWHGLIKSNDATVCYIIASLELNSFGCDSRL
jgi:hypothetical protein